jgi:hypothetical protein
MLRLDGLGTIEVGDGPRNLAGDFILAGKKRVSPLAGL